MIDKDKVMEMHNKGISSKDISKELKVTKRSIDMIIHDSKIPVSRIYEDYRDDIYDFDIARATYNGLKHNITMENYDSVAHALDTIYRILARHSEENTQEFNKYHATIADIMFCEVTA